MRDETPTTEADKVAELVAAIDRARTTAANDDLTEPMTDKRFRHTARIYVMGQAASELSRLSAEVDRLRAASDPLTGKYGDVLAPFVAMMDAELHANSGKGDRPGWLSMSREEVLLEIYYHLAKAQKAALTGDAAGIREFAADVANMSMMLVDVCGELPAESQLAALQQNEPSRLSATQVPR